ncbi:hypothetical protein C8Q70DRAFT_179213 [Cubamyces menziesii]|nr:hypothetical protein C8Q70DRAFT_179213 [Cubamyces menziesii]
MQKGKKVVQRAALLKLPNELLEMIFDELIGDMGFLSLSVTCKDLLAFSKSQLPKFYRWSQPQWGGCRIICLGEDTDRLDQLPQRLLLRRERDEIRADLTESRNVYWALESRYETQGWFQQHITVKWLNRIDDDLSNGVYDEHDGYGHEKDWGLFNAILPHPAHGHDPRPLPGGPEVLCNLEKREYVRKDGLSLPPCVTLAHALFVQTIWSASDNVGIRCEDSVRDRIKQGPWAGDSVCITTVETLPKIRCVEEYFQDDEAEKKEGSEEDGEEADRAGREAARRAWTDVTAEVDSVLVHLFEQDPRSLEDLVNEGGMLNPLLMRDLGEMI